MQIRKSILIFIIVAACLASYFNTLFADFVWDDDVFIVPNVYMQSLKFLPKFFINDFWSISIRKGISEYYRPLLAASFMLDYALWGNNPFGYHLTNVIFHALASVLVFLFVLLLIKDRFIAFISSLLFSVHPVHTEVVSFISGRVDSLPLVFYLLSLILFLKHAQHKKIAFYLLSLVCFAVSLFTKEIAVTLPLIVICIDYFFLSKHGTRNVTRNFLKLHLSYFVVLGAYLVVRYYFAKLPFTIEENLFYWRHFPFGTTLLWRPLTVIKILVLYLKLLFFPYGLNVEYMFLPANSLFEPIVLIGIVILSILFFMVAKNTKRQPILSFSILWFFITILPMSNIIPQGNIFAERYVYTPSVGFCIAIAFLLSWLLKKDIKTHLLNWQKSIYILIFLLIIASGRVTYERNKAWYNDFTLWYDAVKKSPNSSITHVNLALEYFKAGFYEEARKQVSIALQLNPLSKDAFNILGLINLEEGTAEEAIGAFKQAIEFFPYNAEIYSNLAVAYSMNDQFEKAIEAGLVSLEKNPYLDISRYHLATHYKKIGLIDESIEMFEEFLKTNPDSPDVHVDVGYLYFEKGDLRNAERHWFIALKRSKDFPPAKEALKLLED